MKNSTIKSFPLAEMGLCELDNVAKTTTYGGLDIGKKEAIFFLAVCCFAGGGYYLVKKYQEFSLIKNQYGLTPYQEQMMDRTDLLPLRASWHKINDNGKGLTTIYTEELNSPFFSKPYRVDKDNKVVDMLGGVRFKKKYGIIPYFEKVWIYLGKHNVQLLEDVAWKKPGEKDWQGLIKHGVAISIEPKPVSKLAKNPDPEYGEEMQRADIVPIPFCNWERITIKDHSYMLNTKTRVLEAKLMTSSMGSIESYHKMRPIDYLGIQGELCKNQGTGSAYVVDKFALSEPGSSSNISKVGVRDGFIYYHLNDDSCEAKEALVAIDPGVENGPMVWLPIEHTKEALEGLKKFSSWKAGIFAMRGKKEA